MSWFRSAPGLAVAAVLLSACGFRPLYSTGEEVSRSSELAAIRIEPIEDRLGQRIHNHLLDMLNPQGRPANPIYVLRVTLAETRSELGIQKTAFATRANLRVQAQYGLYLAKDGTRLLSGSTAVISGFDILDSEFATLVAADTARTNLARDVAEAIRVPVAVYFAGKDRPAETEQP